MREGGPISYEARPSGLADEPTTCFFFFFITLGLEMSDTKVYEP